MPGQENLALNWTQLRCFQHLNWRPDRDELGRFARAMLIGFFVIGLIAAARHRHMGTTTFVLWTVGAGLALAALVPGLGRVAYLGVYLPTSILGFFISHIVVGLMFFLVFVPVALVVRLTGHDLLRLRRPGARTLWVRRPEPRPSSSYYRQF
jgi:hypothetical protein